MYTENQGALIFFSGVLTGLVFFAIWYCAHKSRSSRLLRQSEERKKAALNDPKRVNFTQPGTDDLTASINSIRQGPNFWADHLQEFRTRVELLAISGYVMIQGEIVKPSNLMMNEEAIQGFVYGTDMSPEVEVVGLLLRGCDRSFKINSLGHITAPPEWVNTFLEHQHLQYDLAWIYELMTEIETDPTQVCHVPYRMTLVDRRMRMVVKVFDDDDWITLGWTGPVLVLQEFTVAGVVPNGPIIPVLDHYLEIHDGVKKLVDEVPAEHLSNTEILNQIEYLEKNLVKR